MLWDDNASLGVRNNSGQASLSRARRDTVVDISSGILSQKKIILKKTELLLFECRSETEIFTFFEKSDLPLKS